MHSFKHLLVCCFATTALGKPVQYTKRYDLDGNGTPDWCYTGNDGIVHCMLSGGAWTSFPASAAPTTSKPISQAQKTSTTLKATPSPTGSLPAPPQFKTDKGSKWKVEYVGDVKFTGQLGTKKLGGDKCRTGKIGDKVIWNCGDMECDGNWQVCGFSQGPAFYGTSDVMTVDTSKVVQVQDNDFVKAWSGDPAPVTPQSAWGMDTSNVVSINATHGVAYAWEIWRGASDGSYVDRGNAVAAVTLGDAKPIATRVGPLLTDGKAVALGLIAILRDGDYIYTYSVGGPSNVIIGRVKADDSVFDKTKYSFLAHDGTSQTWVAGIPNQDTKTIGATTANSSGQFGCAVYGSVFYNTYLRKYVIVCNIFMNYVNMYTSDTPYGPWSAEYQLLAGGNGATGADAKVTGSYGSMVHAEYGNGKEWYFSMGPNSVFNMFKVTFNY